MFAGGLPRAARLAFWPVAAALAAGLAGTGVLFALLWRNAQQADSVRFATLAHFMQERLDDRIEKYEQGLAVLGEFFTHDPLPSQDAWTRLIDRCKLPVNYRGLREVGYAPCLPPERLRQPDERIRGAMGSNCVLHLSSTPRPELLAMPVLYSAGTANHPSAPRGDDLNIPLYQPQLGNIRDRGAAAATRRQSLTPAGAPREVHGFRLFVPVYDASLPLAVARAAGEDNDTYFSRRVQQRQPHFQGAVFGAIDLDELLEGLLEDAVLDIAFEIFDGPEPGRSQRVNSRIALPTAADRRRRPDLTERHSTWRMYGERWTIVFHPTASFERSSPQRGAWLALVAGLAGTACLAGAVAFLLQRRAAAELHARQMNEARDVIRTLAREREEVYRDLHDGVLQSLYGLALGIQKTRKTIARDPREAEAACQRNLAALEEAMGEIRRHLDEGQTRPPTSVDLPSALRNVVDLMHRQGPIPVQYDPCPAPLPALPSAAGLELLQIAREAIANAQRHSGARRIRVSLQTPPGHLEMTVSDDGRGFEPSSLSGRGNGLRNQAERARALGARLELHSAPGAGTRLCVTLAVAGSAAPPPSTPTPRAPEARKPTV